MSLGGDSVTLGDASLCALAYAAKVRVYEVLGERHLGAHFPISLLAKFREKEGWAQDGVYSLIHLDGECRERMARAFVSRLGLTYYDRRIVRDRWAPFWNMRTCAVTFPVVNVAKAGIHIPDDLIDVDY